MSWYRTGTVSVTNGSTTVTGTMTGWLSQVRAEDRISFNGGDKWYEVASVASNTSLTLATAFAETTISGGAYAIDRSSRVWDQTSNVASQIRTLLASVTNILQGTGAPSESLGTDGDLYFDTTNALLYGPKASGAWGSGLAFTRAPDGSAAAPGMCFSADTNTGLFRPSSDVIAVATNGSERVRINSSGGVGIGTTAPSGTLDVRGIGAYYFGNVSNPRLRIWNTGGTPATLYFGADSGVVWFGAESNVPLYFLTNGAEKMRIDASGNVGIGTASPAVKLAVDGPIGLKSYTVGTVPSAATATGQIIYVSNDVGGAVVAFSDGTSWLRVTDRAVIS